MIDNNKDEIGSEPQKTAPSIESLQSDIACLQWNLNSARKRAKYNTLAILFLSLTTMMHSCQISVLKGKIETKELQKEPRKLPLDSNDVHVV